MAGCPQTSATTPLDPKLTKAFLKCIFILHDQHNVNKARKYDLNVKTMSMVHKQTN